MFVDGSYRHSGNHFQGMQSSMYAMHHCCGCCQQANQTQRKYYNTGHCLYPKAAPSGRQSVWHSVSEESDLYAVCPSSFLWKACNFGCPVPKSKSSCTWATHSNCSLLSSWKALIATDLILYFIMHNCVMQKMLGSLQPAFCYRHRQQDMLACTGSHGMTGPLKLRATTAA